MKTIAVAAIVVVFLFSAAVFAASGEWRQATGAALLAVVNGVLFQ